MLVQVSLRINVHNGIIKSKLLQSMNMYGICQIHRIAIELALELWPINTEATDWISKIGYVITFVLPKAKQGMYFQGYSTIQINKGFQQKLILDTGDACLSKILFLFKY